MVDKRTYSILKNHEGSLVRSIAAQHYPNALIDFPEIAPEASDARCHDQEAQPPLTSQVQRPRGGDAVKRFTYRWLGTVTERYRVVRRVSETLVSELRGTVVDPPDTGDQMGAEIRFIECGLFLSYRLHDFGKHSSINLELYR